MKASPFKAVRPKSDVGEHKPVEFECPKCGSDDVARQWMYDTDRLLLMCGSCYYTSTREPLDRQD